MSRGRELAAAVLAALTGAGLGLYTLTRVWSTTEAARVPPLPPAIEETTGSQLAPWAPAAVAVAAAAAAALPAVAGPGRKLAAAALGASGLGLAAAGVLGAMRDVGTWPVATLLCGLWVLAVAVAAWRRAAAWPRMSARYDRKPERRAPVADDPAALWDALDAGRDPSTLSIGKTAPGEECPR